MSAPIGRSLRVPSFVVVGLVLAAIGIRPAPAPGQAPQTPPVPDKSMPVATTTACLPCDGPAPQNPGVTPTALTNYWIKDGTFYVMLDFSDKKLHDAFVDKARHQVAYLCYKVDGQATGVRWPFLKKKAKGDGRHVLLAFKVCIPDGMQADRGEEGGGTGTGTVIIVTNPVTPTGNYQANGMLTGLEPM